jgi:hypothetical protein
MITDPDVIREILKERIRKLSPGGCRVISMGDDCDCSLCLIDNLVFRIRELEEKELKKS